MDEHKGVIMTLFGAAVASFLFYKIDYPINNETVKCVISVVLGILFCALYMIEGLGKIPKLLTGFIVSYVAGMPIYWMNKLRFFYTTISIVFRNS